MQRSVLTFIAISACLILASAAPPAKPAAKKVPVKKAGPPKIACTVCQGVGTDCKSEKTDSKCDKCAKFTGVADDPKEVPEYMWGIMPAGSKDAMTKNKGQKMTFRGCATQELIDVATLGDTYEEYGCTDFDEMFGFKDATGCLCKGNCQ